MDNKSTKMHSEKNQLPVVIKSSEESSSKSEINSLNRTFDLERQECRDLETTVLNLINEAKIKWRATKKDKIPKLNEEIEAKIVIINELCTSNSNITSRIQELQCNLETSAGKLEKISTYQIQFEESLAKAEELLNQNFEDEYDELERELKFAENTGLENELRSNGDSNHCLMSKLNGELEHTQSELNECQEELRSIQSMIFN